MATLCPVVTCSATLTWASYLDDEQSVLCCAQGCYSYMEKDQSRIPCRMNQYPGSCLNGSLTKKTLHSGWHPELGRGPLCTVYERMS